jgi:hypothetical protein
MVSDIHLAFLWGMLSASVLTSLEFWIQRQRFYLFWLLCFTGISLTKLVYSVISKRRQLMKLGLSLKDKPGGK